MPKCLCGCGRNVSPGNGRVYFDAAVCRPRRFKKALVCGCLPIDKIRFATCVNCDVEFIYWVGSPRKTCTQITGSKCNRQNHKKQMTGYNFESVTEKDKRPEYIAAYCINQRLGECAEYAKGFDIDNIEAGCWGRNYTGDCYQRPKLATASLKAGGVIFGAHQWRVA